MIAKYLDVQSDIYALLRVNRHLSQLLQKRLLQHNVDFEESSALPAAARSGNGDLARKLLDMGADVDTKAGCSDKLTALHYAAKEGHLSIIRMLLSRGADTLSVDSSGNRPIFMALEEGNESVAWLLYAAMKGSAVSVGNTYFNKSSLHQTLHRASKNDTHFGYKKPFSIRDHDNPTPLHAACFFKLPNSVLYFLNAGWSSVHASAVLDVTPLHLVLLTSARLSEYDDVFDIIQILWTSGADPDAEMLPSVVTASEEGRIKMSARDLAKLHPDVRVRKLFESMPKSHVDQDDIVHRA